MLEAVVSVSRDTRNRAARRGKTFQPQRMHLPSRSTAVCTASQRVHAEAGRSCANPTAQADLLCTFLGVLIIYDCGGRSCPGTYAVYAD